jgi:alpha-L-fucosidase 2
MSPSDCQSPLMKFIVDLPVTGESTASQFYGCLGWVAHVFTNACSFTHPGWEISWGLNVTGGLWLPTLMIEFCKYALDLEFLERHAYPVLKQAAIFF